jgi:hypothetical protein
MELKKVLQTGSLFELKKEHGGTGTHPLARR